MTDERAGSRPGIGSIFVLAYLVILVPGIAVYLVTHALGLALGPACLLGLLAVFVGLGFYPKVLVRLGWVRRRRRPAAGRRPEAVRARRTGGTDEPG